MLRLFVFGLSVWRLSRAIAIERGPADAFAKLRGNVAAKYPYAPPSAGAYLTASDYDDTGRAHSWQRAGINCPLCVSFWVGLIAGGLSLVRGKHKETVDAVFTGLALAGVAALLNRIEAKLNG